MEIIQLLVGPMDVYSYILICPDSKEAVVIDAAYEAERIYKVVQDKQAKVLKIINTHEHADHTAGNARFVELTGAPLVAYKDADLNSARAKQFARMMGCPVSPPADEKVDDHDVIKFGQCSLEVIYTPGHSLGSICLYTPGNVFTGDTLFVGAVGRTDFPGGSWPQLLQSIQQRLLTLPGETVVWPGHAYGPTPNSTIEREARENPFIR